MPFYLLSLRESCRKNVTVLCEDGRLCRPYGKFPKIRIRAAARTLLMVPSVSTARHFGTSQVARFFDFWLDSLESHLCDTGKEIQILCFILLFVGSKWVFH